MKKFIKLFIGMIGFILFFIFIDGSCIDLKQKFAKISAWAKK